jgi:hypothetical protein
MAVIKSSGRPYMLKSVGIPEYYLGGNVPWRSMEESVNWISSFCKDLHPKHHTEIRRHFWQEIGVHQDTHE